MRKEWEEVGRTLNNSDIPCDTTSGLLFATATSIIVGDYVKTSFWSSACLKVKGLKI
jgi:hypothetical protein